MSDQEIIVLPLSLGLIKFLEIGFPLLGVGGGGGGGTEKPACLLEKRLLRCPTKAEKCYHVGSFVTNQLSLRH